MTTSWRTLRNRQNATMREALAEVAAAREAEEAQRKAARAAARVAEAARPRLTAEDVAGAWAVRDEVGWHRVVRVSAKSVTVATPWSWTERIPLGKVLEVRR